MRAAWCLLLAAVASGPPQDTLTVSAAVSLTESLEAVSRAYRAAGGGPVSFNLAASNVLSRQIVRGAPVDVFISADDSQMDVVERADMLLPGTRVVVVRNRLVVIAAPGGPSVLSVRDLTAAAVRRIAVGDPAAVPAGVYTKTYLERIGLWTALQPKLVPTTSVRAALTAVQNGSVDAGFVYATDAGVAPGVRVAVTINGPESPRIAYPAAVIRTTRHAADARRFVEFLCGPEAQAVFARRGFVPTARIP